MNEEFIRFLELSTVNGVFSTENTELLLQKAAQLGIDEIEAKLTIDKYVRSINLEQGQKPTDDYDITDDELVARLSRYTSSLDKAKVSLQMEPFPKQLGSLGKVGTAVNESRKVLASLTKNDILSDSFKIIGGSSPLPGGALVGKLAGKGTSSLISKVAGADVRTMKFEDVIELANRYMVILSLRASKNEFLNSKYLEFKTRIQNAQDAPPKKSWF